MDNKEKISQYFHEYYLANKEKIIARSRARHRAKHSEILEKQREYRNRPGMLQRRVAATAAWRKAHPGCRRKEVLGLYKLSETDFQKMMASQDGCCAICKEDFLKMRPKIDHRHSCCSGIRSCGKCVRGLLCNRCNVILHVLENPQLLKSAQDYLAFWEEGHAENHSAVPTAAYVRTVPSDQAG